MRRHPIDVLAAVCGLLALGCAGAWFAWSQSLLSVDQLVVAAPIALIVVGLAGIAASLLSGTRRGAAAAPLTPPVPPDLVSDTHFDTGFDTHFDTDVDTDTLPDLEPDTRSEPPEETR